MIRCTVTFILVLGLFISFTFDISYASEKYQLRLATDKIELEYETDTRSTMNLHMQNLPLPGSSVNISNVESRQIEHSWLSVLEYDKEIDKIKMLVKQKPGMMRVGYDYFQLPPMEILMSEVLKQMGNVQPDDFDFDIPEYQEMILHVTPQGDLLGFDIAMPDDYKMQAGIALNMMENFAVMISEPTFPKDPVGIGDTWIQKVNLDKLPMVDLKSIDFTYRLEGAEKDQDGDTIARISFETNHRQNLDMLDKVVVGETFEYYENKEFEVRNTQIYFDIKMYGSLKFNVDKGYIVDGRTESEVVFYGGVDLKKLQGHNKGEMWMPSVEMSIFSVAEIDMINCN